MSNRPQSKSIFIIIMLLFPLELLAASVPDLAAYLEQEIGSLEHAVAGSPGELERKPEMGQELKDVSEPSRIEGLNDFFLFKNLWVRIRPRVIFGLPGMATIQIIPDVEMLWQKQNPTGWVIYRPDE
ncbi:MAG: hypothetical protein ABIQ95_16655 [Bdellovibrionia bacterium]